ncbi:hypothetical protein ACWD4F_34680 [Streptomyces aureus]|uniref:hypothetical protein n=1 Tax=Streptomyces aureus TaxID=193461 RepID=UPI00056D4456|nr:hypothetical protein [Streptomyces aureus]
MTASLVCKKVFSLAAGAVYSWETVEGLTGYVLIDAGASVVRVSTPEGGPCGGMSLDKGVGNLENPDPDPALRRAFVAVAAAILRDAERQGRLPERVSRTYW